MNFFEKVYKIIEYLASDKEPFNKAYFSDDQDFERQLCKIQEGDLLDFELVERITYEFSGIYIGYKWYVVQLSNGEEIYY